MGKDKILVEKFNFWTEIKEKEMKERKNPFHEHRDSLKKENNEIYFNARGREIWVNNAIIKKTFYTQEELI